MSTPSTSVFGRLLTSPPPPAAIEISSRRVNVVALSSQGSTRTITGQASEPLADGVVTPALERAERPRCGGARGSGQGGGGTRVAASEARGAPAARHDRQGVAACGSTRCQPKVQDLEQLIRWQVRKAAPFRIEDAQVSWVEGAATTSGGA